jgi:ATP-dependent Clp protease ATP-binding subunit ClpB
MDTGKFTEKAREGLAEAQALAARLGHQEVDVEHLALALVEQSAGLVPRTLEKMGVNPLAFAGALEEQLKKRPSLSGPGVEAGKFVVSQRLAKALAEAQKNARALKDE